MKSVHFPFGVSFGGKAYLLTASTRHKFRQSSQCIGCGAIVFDQFDECGRADIFAPDQPQPCQFLAVAQLYAGWGIEGGESPLLADFTFGTAD